MEKKINGGERSNMERLVKGKGCSLLVRVERKG